jgi:hypothetical protein
VHWGVTEKLVPMEMNVRGLDLAFTLFGTNNLNPVLNLASRSVVQEVALDIT